MDESDDRDPLEGLEARLEAHDKTLQSLLALTPAQDYYGTQIIDGKDPSEQWNRKKQTKEQKRAGKMAKLDPANQKSALDVMKERKAAALAKKRKRDEGGNDSDDGESREDEVEGKRQKGELDADAAEARRREKADKRKEKRLRKKEKSLEKKAKAEAKKAKKQERDSPEAHDEMHAEDRRPESHGMEPELADQSHEMDEVDLSGLADVDAVDAEEIEEDNDASEGSSAPTTPVVDSPAFDLGTNHSAASSSSSILPSSVTIQPEPPQPSKQAETKPALEIKTSTSTTTDAPTTSLDPSSGTSSPKLQLPDINDAELHERLRKRIEELRAARKANGPDGNPAKSRQELLEQRRKKEEQRKAAKKAQRQKAREEEDRRRDEQLRGSGSPLSADIFSPQPRETSDNFSFSRLAFEDGTSADHSLTSLQDPKKKKGPQDPRTALQAAQTKQSRIAGYDANKRADIQDKDMWLNAKKRAHGERVRDDTSLLKKALKRKEKQKTKSENDWKEREQAVVKGREMKQKKREANLQKRREEKGGGGNKGKKKGGKKKGRPGFEGRFKA